MPGNPPTIQFEDPTGPGPSFQTAPESLVQRLIFVYDNGQSGTAASAPTLPSDAPGSSETPVQVDMDDIQPTSVHGGYDDETMTSLLDLDTYLTEQRARYLPSTSAEPEDDGDDDDGGVGDTGDSNPEATNPGNNELKPAPRGKYRQYTDKQWEDFLKDVTLGFGLLNVSDAAKKAGINPRTARDKLRQFMKNTEEGFLVHRRTREGAKGGRVPILNEEHTKFIIDYFGDKPEACIRDLKRALVEKFVGLEVSYSTLHRHVKKECRFSLQRVVVQPEGRFTDKTLDQR